MESWLISYDRSSEEKSTRINEFFRLIKQNTEENYSALKESLSEDWDNEFKKYFETCLNNAILNHSGRWIIYPTGLYCPLSGITTNAAESFNNVLKMWNNWKEMPIDALVLSLQYLTNFYEREITRGFMAWETTR